MTQDQAKNIYVGSLFAVVSVYVLAIRALELSRMHAGLLFIAIVVFFRWVLAPWLFREEDGDTKQ